MSASKKISDFSASRTIETNAAFKPSATQYFRSHDTVRSRPARAAPCPPPYRPAGEGARDAWIINRQPTYAPREASEEELYWKARLSKPEYRGKFGKAKAGGKGGAQGSSPRESSFPRILTPRVEEGEMVGGGSTLRRTFVRETDRAALEERNRRVADHVLERLRDRVASVAV